MQSHNMNSLDVSSPTGFIKNITADGLQLLRHLVNLYKERSTGQKVGIILIGLLGLTANIIFITYHNEIIKFAISVADYWSSLGFLGGVLLFTLITLVGFPPLIGYSMLSVMTGMIYGLLPIGWPILASGTVIGSSLSFLVFKHLLHEKAVMLIDHNENLKIFANVLNGGGFKESLLLLCLIRLCPLPYSLSNGALAAIPGLQFRTFSLASLLTTPKVFIHLFVGSKIRNFGLEKDTASKVVDVISICITMVSFMSVTYIIYSKVKAKLIERDSSYISLDSEISSSVSPRFDDDDDFEV